MQLFFQKTRYIKIDLLADVYVSDTQTISSQKKGLTMLP